MKMKTKIDPDINFSLNQIKKYTKNIINYFFLEWEVVKISHISVIKKQLTSRK